MSAALETLREHVARGAGVTPESIALHAPLVESGLLTSLQAVELLALCETLTGRALDPSRVRPGTFRSLASIARDLLDEPPLPVLRGDDLRAMRRLDSLIVDAARDDGAPEERHLPLLPMDAARRAGWLASFPHLVTFAAPVAREDAARAEVARSQAVTPAQLEAPDLALAPAACLAGLASRSGSSRDAESFTLESTCHRAESCEQAFVRQRCFTMREVVTIGSPESCETFVARWEERLPRLAEALGVGARLEEASDPFFDPSRDPKAHAQALFGATKRELVDARGVAVASLNRHRAFFCDAFGIARQDGPCWSACVAFGMERWVGALRGASPDWRLAAEALR